MDTAGDGRGVRGGEANAHTLQYCVNSAIPPKIEGIIVPILSLYCYIYNRPRAPCKRWLGSCPQCAFALYCECLVFSLASVGFFAPGWARHRPAIAHPPRHDTKREQRNQHCHSWEATAGSDRESRPSAFTDILTIM